MTETQDSVRSRNVSPERAGHLECVTVADEPVDFASLSNTHSVAALNLSPRPGDVDHNLRLAEEAVVRVRLAHPLLKWVVLPELFTSGYADLPSAHLHAEDAGRGDSLRFFTRLARKLDLYIAYGFPERLPGAAGVSGIADSANLVGPEGLIFTYRKRHLVRETGEDLVFVAGTALPVVEAGGISVALAICWDLGFPETVREAVGKGADLILAPAGWRDPFGPQYQLSCAARALDNAVYLASANQQGSYFEAEFHARGEVYGPDGIRVSTRDGMASVGNIQPSALGLWRSRYGSTFPESRIEYATGELVG